MSWDSVLPLPSIFSKRHDPLLDSDGWRGDLIATMATRVSAGTELDLAGNAPSGRLAVQHGDALRVLINREGENGSLADASKMRPKLSTCRSDSLSPAARITAVESNLAEKPARRSPAVWRCRRSQPRGSTRMSADWNLRSVRLREFSCRFQNHTCRLLADVGADLAYRAVRGGNARVVENGGAAVIPIATDGTSRVLPRRHVASSDSVETNMLKRRSVRFGLD